MTEESGQDGAPAQPAETPETLALDKEHQAALFDQHHPAHRQAVERQTRAYAARHGDTAHSELAGQMERDRVGDGSGVTPLASPDFVEMEMRQGLSEQGLEAVSEGEGSGKVEGAQPDLSALPFLAGQPHNRAQVEEAMADIPEPTARQLVDRFEKVTQTGAPRREDAEAQLARELGPEKAKLTMEKARQKFSKLPGAKTLKEALERTGAGNDPEIVKTMAGLAD